MSGALDAHRVIGRCLMKSTQDTTITEIRSCDNCAELRIEAQERPRRAYLVRCWREGGTTAPQGPLWRFSAEEVSGDRRRCGFCSIEALAAFIRGDLRDMDSDEGFVTELGKSSF